MTKRIIPVTRRGVLKGGSALAGAAVNVQLINQGASELNIIVGVAPEDYPQAVRSIYDAFIGQAGPGRSQ